MALLPILLLALVAVVPIQAFTNGSLVPSYFCHPDGDGHATLFGPAAALFARRQNRPDSVQQQLFVLSQLS